jgi:hypothetical protein
MTLFFEVCDFEAIIYLIPLRAGLVNKASEYLYSSASNYVNGDGLLCINRAENPVIDVLKQPTFWKSISW